MHGFYALAAGLLPVLLFCAGCHGGSPAQRSSFPNVLMLGDGDTLRLGAVLPGAAPGEVWAYPGLHLPDGTTQVFVEVDSLGEARSFELWYAPETAYADVVAFYERRLGMPARRYERLVGECTVWEGGGYAFDLCRSRGPEAHGEVIAHLWPQ
jgi:hypothetical protein